MEASAKKNLIVFKRPKRLQVLVFLEHSLDVFNQNAYMSDGKCEFFHMYIVKLTISFLLFLPFIFSPFVCELLSLWTWSFPFVCSLQFYAISPEYKLTLSNISKSLSTPKNFGHMLTDSNGEKGT